MVLSCRPHFRLLRCGAAPAAATVSAAVQFVSHSGQSPESQKTALRHAIRTHEIAVQRNAYRKQTDHSTYDDLTCSFFPEYKLCCLPATNGLHRESVRRQLVSSGVISEVGTALLAPWQVSASRRAVIVGAKSTDYLLRQLEMDEEYAVLVIDHSLKALANSAAKLVPRFHSRVSFLRAEPMFTCLEVLAPSSVDVVVAAMPAPFWSERGSHRRLVNRDFLWAAHRITALRTSLDDPRGFVCFTDSEPYADFAMEQLEEAKLLVPWTRKNAHQTYARWLPLSATDKDARREFAQQRFPEVIAIAASKSGETTTQALAHMASYDYRRRYYRALCGDDAPATAPTLTDD